MSADRDNSSDCNVCSPGYGKSVQVERIVLKPCYDDYGKIGGGFGFPVRFKIEVSDTQAYRQFGNSVAVPVVTALAKQVMAALQHPGSTGSGTARPALPAC